MPLRGINNFPQDNTHTPPPLATTPSPSVTRPTNLTAPCSPHCKPHILTTSHSNNAQPREKNKKELKACELEEGLHGYFLKLFKSLTLAFFSFLNE